MLRKVYRNEIIEGMRFSAPVFFDDGQNMLVHKGVPIKKRELDVLDRWKFPYVLTAGAVMSENQKIVESPPEDIDVLEELDELEELDDLDDASQTSVATEKKTISETSTPVTIDTHKTKVSTALEKPSLDKIEYTADQILKLPEVLENTGLYHKYFGLISELHTIFEDIKARKEVRTRAIDKIVSDLFGLVQNERSDILGFILGGDINNMDQAKCAVNTAILSIIIGDHLGLPRHRVLQVATGAVLHDIGMMKVSPAILSKETKLDETEIQTMRSHTSYGYKVIVNELLYSDEVGKAAIQHHERWDGEGYPARLSGTQIDIGARIISAADAFEAMVSPKAYRNSMVGYQAMKNLLSDNARRFDPEIIKAMIQSMGIYPVGSIILLNNSVIARVVQSNKDAPLRPRIRVLIDEFAKPYPLNGGEIIDLQENRTLFIARAIDPKEYHRAR